MNIRDKSDVIIIGAGASGLMCALELVKAGKKVYVLEGRSRVGGRIAPLSKDDFGYEAQAGAEFVHGPAPITRALIKEAGLTYLSTDGDMWMSREGVLVKQGDGPSDDPDIADSIKAVQQKITELESDMPLSEFLQKYFSETKYEKLRIWLRERSEGYDAADPERMSVRYLEEEWLGGSEWQQGRIKEGYGALVDFLRSECIRLGVSFEFKKKVQKIQTKSSGIQVSCSDGTSFSAEKVVVTVSIRAIENITFEPAIPEKSAAAQQIGFGDVIKVLFKFKDRWWVSAQGKDLNNLIFIFTEHPKVRLWWTQFPLQETTLTGWISGPNATDLEYATEQEIIGLGVESIAEAFNVEQSFVEQHLALAKIFNWRTDPFTRGAYSYPTPETKDAIKVLSEPVKGLYFAGEGIYEGAASATVEGALANGKEVAQKILS